MGLFGGSKESSPSKTSASFKSVASKPDPTPTSPPANLSSGPPQPSVTALLEQRLKEMERRLQEQEHANSSRLSDARDEVSKARLELAEAEQRWSKEKTELEGVRSNLLQEVQKLKSPPIPPPKAPLYVEMTLTNALFSRPFNFFIEAELHGVRDNTEVSHVSETPAFVRTLVFRVNDAPNFPASLILTAKAYLDEATQKVLGTARVALESPFFEASEVKTPVAVDFVRNSAVYGKCVVTLRYFRSVNATLAEPIKLEKPFPNAFDGVPLLKPKQYIKISDRVGAQIDVGRMTQGESDPKIQQLEEELSAKTTELDFRNAVNLSLSDAVISELSNLSNIELRDRLIEATQRYRTERMRLQAMTAEVAAANATKKALEEERATLLMRLETLNRRPQIEDEQKYRETILAQEEVIRKLEKIIETSVKKIQSAQDTRNELERLRAENKKLRDSRSEISRDHFDIDGTLKQRVIALEEELIEAAKRHARELAKLKLATSSFPCVWNSRRVSELK